MVIERALKQEFFFSRSVQFSLSVHESSIFPCSISLHPLVCGITDQAAHYHALNS